MEEHSNKRKLVTLKIYFDRARMYLGYINFFILNMVLINSIENPILKEYITNYKWIVVPVIFILYVFVLLLIGYLDTKNGFRQEELRNNAALNPVMQDLMTRIEDIQNKVTELSNEKESDNFKTDKHQIQQ